MNDSTDPLRPAPLRRIALLGVLFVAAIMSCGKDVTGPLSSAVRYVRGFSWSPIFPPAFQLAGGSTSGVVVIDSVHLVLHHSDGTVALDTTVTFPAGADEITLSLTIKLLDSAPASGEPMTIDLGYLDANGDVVFKGGPVSVTVAPPPAGTKQNPPVQVPVTYTGPGANAVAVVISPRSVTAVSGASFSFSAVAKDNTGTPIAGTPIVWSSLDPTIATITSGLAGAGIAQNQRGAAHIVAQLLTGQADTAIVNVSLPASQISVQSGNAQTGVVGTNLALPLVVKVAASDAVGVAGTTVTFAVATGGGSVANASVVADANGFAQTTWKLGTGTGAQSVTATAGTLTNSPLTFTATAIAATATKLVNTTAPANGVAGVALAPVVFTAEDNNGNVATNFTGPVAVSFGSTVTGATLTGTTTVNAVAGVATFSTLAINKNGTGYTLVGSSSGLPNDTTAAFAVAVGAPSKLAFTVPPSAAIANTAITPAIVVTAEDSQGNVTPTFTGAVTLAIATNPTGATLGGTATLPAVAGVATFSNITLSFAGTGYTLSAAATGLTTATSALFNMGGGVATTIVVASGAAQTGLPSTALALPVVVQVNDAGSNPVAGTLVNFAIVTGGGSVAPTSGVSNSSGQVSTIWTLGATIGAQSISATSAGLAGSPLTINATASAGAFSKTWTGVTSTAWTTATNWAPSGVPAAGDSVDVPSGGNQPIMSAAVTVKHLTLAAGATLTFTASPTLTVTGNLNVGGALVGAGTVALTGTGSVRGTIAPNVSVSGTYAASSALTLAGTLTVTGSLDINGQTVTVAGPFQTATAGTIKMNSAATMTVAGDITFGGGSETGLITAGTISGTGNFSQSGGATSFVATGTNVVQLAAAAAKTLTMSSPATATFENLTTANTAGLTLASDIAVTNLMTVTAGTVTGAGRTATLGSLVDTGPGLAVSTIVFTGSTIASPAVINANVSITNNPTQLLANVTVNGSVSVTGNLQLNTHYLTVTGNFSTFGSGQLTMTNASDSVSIGGNATFSGGVEAGILAAGKIKLAGNFSQLTNSGGQEFKAVAGHQTVLVGSGAQTVYFANPDTSAAVCSLSCFGDFTITKTAGTVTFTSAAGANGSVNVNAGVTSVAALSLITSPEFMVVRGSTTTAAGTGVHISRLGTYGALSLDASTTADTVEFRGTSAQTIPAGSYGAVVIKGTPTVGVGGFSTTADLIVGNGGNLTLGGQGVVVGARFITTGSGTLTMTNPGDSLFVTDTARFSGGAEAGLLTNGALLIYTAFTVQGAGQFAATGSHMTYLVGTNAVGCNTCDIHDTRARRMTRAQYQASVAARSAARAPLVAMLVPRAAAIQAAIAATGVPKSPVALTAAQQQQRARQLGGGLKTASHLPITPTTGNLIGVNFGSTSGNSFGNVRIMGGVDWQTPASVVNNVDFDPTHGGTLAGMGHVTVGGALAGPKDSSSVAIYAVELAGTGGGSFADLGYFSPDTTIWSGTNQQMAGDANGRFIDWYNVVVNSSTLFAFDDSITIDIGASLFIQNGGQLILGRSTDPTEMDVNGGIETHQTGTLRMDNNGSTQLYVSGNAWFDGGSETGILTQGQITFGANFKQTSTNSTSSYAANTPHLSWFAGYTGTDTVSFASPGNALSHFGDFYLSAATTVLLSDVFAVGELQTGGGSSFLVHSAVDHLITSNGSNLRNIVFDNVRWKTAGTDGNSLFPALDNVIFQNISATTLPQFDYEYSIKTNLSLPGFTFSTVPTGGGVYIKVVGPDTLTMSSTSPSISSGFVSVSGGGAVNGWSAVVASWTCGGTTDWNTPGNWSTGLVPDASTDVLIGCDGTAPQTSAAAAVHNLTMNGVGTQLSLGPSAPLTVNGDLSIAALSNIAVGTNNLTLLGNVYTDTSASFGGITCSAGNRSTGAIISGTGTHNVYGKFCGLTVAGNYMATGRILVKHTTAGDAGLTVQSGNLNLNGHRVETDSMYTISTGTITMQNAADSLVLHGANVGVPVYFNGGSTTGLITNGTIIDHSPYFQANGSAFDAANGSNTIVADSVSFQGFKWIGATLGVGINNLFAKNTSKSFTSDLVINGVLTLDASMTTSGLFQGTSHNLYASQIVDNTGNVNGGFSGGGYWLHITGGSTLPAVIGVDSLFLASGGNISLSQNLSTHVLVIQDNLSPTGLILSGHTVTTNNFSFVTTGSSFVQMTAANDSLAVGTGSVYFNGGGYSNVLTAGGIAAGGFYQGYTNATTLAAGTAANSYNPSGTHRLWLTQNAPIIFANPGTGTSLSHFNTLRNPSGYTSTLYSDVFVDDSLYFATGGTAIFNSNVISSAANTRLITTKGLADNTTSTGIEFNNVALSWIDGQNAPTHFDNVQWTGFPLLYTGTAFTVNRSTSSAPTFASHDFTALVLSGLSGGHFVNNISPSTGPTLNFTSVLGIPLVTNFSVAYNTSYQYP